MPNFFDKIQRTESSDNMSGNNDYFVESDTRKTFPAVAIQENIQMKKDLNQLSSNNSTIQLKNWGSLGGSLINNSSRNIRFWTGDSAEERAGGSIHGTAEILPAHSSTSGDRDLDMFEWRGVWYKVKNLITAEVNDGDEHPSQSWGSIARGAVVTGVASGVGGIVGGMFGASGLGGAVASGVVAHRWSEGLRPATVEEIGYVRATKPDWFI